MSFVKNLLFGGVKTSEDPTGVSGDAKDSQQTENKEPIVEGQFYPRTLYKFNGHDDEKIFLAIKGKVFDCTQGRQFYGPSGPYSNFAGHDASRGLATNSFELDTLKHWNQPMDDLSDLQKADLEALNGWLEHFEKKYPCIGVLVPEPGVNV
ncbi:LANO_0H16380g1_1 [Lachancea nothofagi CBS 11611]|uniref:LANO_0H16380g1_1 n=1 Tax=Lachancea nothofagi CBS 11611 TaxID=1266666 RepID=A0A1G4KMX8_9SACH|nr:LANO_0H16380g1_1 [Lachancea nothofagi CBS 11611]